MRFEYEVTDYHSLNSQILKAWSPFGDVIVRGSRNFRRCGLAGGSRSWEAGFSLGLSTVCVVKKLSSLNLILPTS